MPLIDKERAYTELKHEQYTHGLSLTAEAFEKAARIIDQMPTIPDIDRSAILQLCNEIEDIAQDIKARTMSDSYFQAQCIIDKAINIEKVLNNE